MYAGGFVKGIKSVNSHSEATGSIFLGGETEQADYDGHHNGSSSRSKAKQSGNLGS